jgi:hypothetical protein
MATVDDVLNALVQSVNAGLEAASLPNSDIVDKGKPNADQIVSIVSASGFIVAIYSSPVSRNTTRFPPKTIGTMRLKGRVDQRVQVTIWAATGAQRIAAASAIQKAVGNGEPSSNWLTLPDNTRTWVRYANGPVLVDESVQTKNLKRADLLFDCEYSITGTVAVQQITEGVVVSDVDGKTETTTVT